MAKQELTSEQRYLLVGTILFLSGLVLLIPTIIWTLGLIVTLKVGGMVTGAVLVYLGLLTIDKA